MAKREKTLDDRVAERFPKLPPIPTGKEFNEEFKIRGGVVTNKLEERKKLKYNMHMFKKVKDIRKQVQDKDIVFYNREFVKWKHKRAELIAHAETYPRSPMPAELRNSIRKLSKPHVRHYPGIEKDLEVLLDEVAEVLYTEPEYEEAVNRVVMRFGPYSPVRLPPFKYGGHTENRENFLQMQKLAHSRLYHIYPAMRDLLSKIVMFLPKTAFDLENLRNARGFTFAQFNELLESRISQMFMNVRMNWYLEAKTYMEVHVSKMPHLVALRYHRGAGALLRSYIGVILLHTVETFVDIIGDDKKTPFFRLELSFDANTQNKIEPNQEHLKNYYFQVIDDILQLSKQLPRMECACPTELTDIPCAEIREPNSFICRIRHKLTDNLKLVFQPLEDHLSKLLEDFAPLYDLANEDDILTKDDLSFEKGCELIQLFRTQLSNVKFLQPVMKFSVGNVDQTRLINALTKLAQGAIDTMSARTVELLYINMGDIIEMYEFLRMKAETVPYSTAELLELSQYMLWVSATHVHELSQRTGSAVKDLLRLIDIAHVPTRCFDRLNETMKWIFEVPSILEENASMLERVKFELEENLQRKVEKLNAEIRKIQPVLEQFDYMDDTDRAYEYLKDMRRLLKHIQILDKLQTWINHEETLFKFPVSSYPELEELKRYIAPFFRLVYVCMKWRRCYNVWMDGPFEYLQAELVEETVDGFYKELQKTGKTFRNKIKQMIADNNPRRFKGIVDDPDPLNLPAPLKLCTKAMQQIKDFRPNITVISIFCSSALYQRHWDEMSEVAGYDITPNAGTTLRKLVDRGLGPQLDKYEIISTGAVKERQLYLNLQKMMSEWEDIRFKTSTYKETGIPILSGLDDIQAVLEDHIIKTLTLRGSVFVKYYEESVKAWYDKITRMNNTLEEWGKVQSQWLYLLPIFSSEDIIAQMPEEGVLFKQVDNTYRRYMSAVEKDDHVLATAGTVGMLEAMQECTELLDQINDGVANYLEKKRLFFSRFFFLSNDEMLEILSETKDPLRVQPHLRKCFEGINKLEFNKELEILAMYSQEEEKINIVTKINTEAAHGSVEKWLVQVEEQMVISVRNEIEMSFEDYSMKARTEWVKLWPGQVVLAVSQVYWTANVHRCLNAEMEGSLVDFHIELTSQLQDIVDLVRSPEITNLVRITIKALIVLDVHAKDVVKELISKNVQFENEFKWLAQLRYYWTDNCLVRMINATIPYAYEYLGNSDRLVITPLTDRCYRTLIGAYHLHLNGAPEGPAGTGKTETTKDLAKALAVQCVVFNCSDGLDYKAMGKFFKGLASSGAWACFDEFNRIEIEVLSVVAQQILSIVLAVRANLTKFVFEGTELTLNPAVYICITMNPGYAGRSELPDNLKVLFRTVAMMVPDYAMIGEISLYSYGFKNARTLAVKIVTTYKLCSEQLSSQNHYDYGMRAVKTVLSACGNIKRKFPDENEDILLLRSLIDVNLPKFLTHDVPLFQGIISDLFPGVVLPQPNYDDIISACEDACKTRNLQPREIFLEKIIQTYEMMIVRHGFMLVGDPFSGKTSTLKVLADALRIMSERGLDQVPVNYQFINPKSITMGQLYGQFDPVSYEWTDGVVATCYRQFAMDTSGDRNWVIFDGPVDAVWIENMNTVLDDNKKLCLTSGEVISMTSKMSMIFEVMDLAQASPATVSRCGMIYMESANLGWRPFFESWINKVNPEWGEENRDLITTLYDWAMPPCLQFVKKQCHQYVYPGDVNIALSTMQIMEMMLNDACVEFPDESRLFAPWIQATFMLSLCWGLAGILDADSRLKFDEFHKELWKDNNEEYRFPETEKLEVPIPTDGLLMEYLYIFKTPKGSWKYWPDLVRQQRINEVGSVQQIIIPTVDTARYMYMIEMLIRHNKSVLLVGPTGTGKSFYMQDLLMNGLDQELCEPAFLAFTAQTQANQTQDLIISKLVKGKRGNFGAPKGKRCIIFIDDINMPAKEVYGAQPPIELLRQFFDHQHWYNLKDTTKIFLHNVLFVAAMGLVGGSRQELYARFLRHFTIFSINDFSEESMVKIFSHVLLIALKRNGFATDVMMNVQCIVSATLDLFKGANTDLLPTPAKSHYVFNLRDFSRVIQGCGMLKKDSAENKRIFAKLWVHESLRVFNDRLVDDNDKNWLFMKLQQCVLDHFKDRFDIVFENLRNEEKQVTQVELQRLMFGTYLDLDAPEEERKYEEIESLDILKEVAYNYLDEYNATHKTKMDIVLFTFALEHLSKLCRILSMSRGSALLVGIGGSGRQSLTRLATTICGHNFFQPEITKNYGLNEFRDDIKLVLKQSGGLGKHTVFLFTEDQLKEDSFLQDIDSLLNSGEVPNLYAIDEKQEILELVRLAAQGGNRNLDISPLAVFAFFTNRCREKLHIVLSFSPIGASFRSRLRLYPSLVSCCTIDWYEAWPEDALEAVAHNWMKDLSVTADVQAAAIKACKYFHICARTISDTFYQQSMRKSYITSASYLNLIISYQVLINKKQHEIMQAKYRYLSGLEKLQFAAEQVSVMQVSLEELQPKLAAMTEKATAMLKEIERETKEAEHASMLVREDEKVANVQAARAKSLKAECEADLAQAIPILEEAIEALNTLKPADITLVKSMKNPPAAIKLVMAAVCVIKDVKPDRIPNPATGRMQLDYWGPSKKILGEMNFLQQLKDFDKDNIPIAIMQRIRKEFLPHKDFRPEVVAKASSAAEGLCKWIIAMDLYDAVAREVAPKKEKLEKAEAEFNSTMEILQEKRNQVERLEKRVNDLKEQLFNAELEQARLKEEVDLCSEKLSRAKKLIGGLGGEKSRWMQAAEDLQRQYDDLPGNILVSCGVIAYLAPYTIQYRVDAVKDWLDYCKKSNIPCSDDYDFCDVLGSEVETQAWYISGLPRDEFSTQNAIIQNSSQRWSLLIDPQLQANKWIKEHEKRNYLSIVKLSDPNYMKVIENCIEFGMPVLIENILETLDPPLDPLLQKKTFKQGGELVISLGDNVIHYDEKFRMYLTSKLRNPHYLPEVFNKVTIVNFSLTAEGLEDQLLGIVVTYEKTELQQQKERLVVESAENKAALKNVEDSILKTLSESKGNILEDEKAIEVLDYSKTLAAEITSRQAITRKTEKEIEKYREMYRPVAAYSTALYYTISDLPHVDPMYQYSLNWFLNLYRTSIVNSRKSKDLDERMDNIKTLFTYNLYTNICRSLFEKDKLLYSFVLCTKIMIFQKELTDQYYRFFLTGGFNIANPLENPAPDWLSQKQWDEFCRLSDLSHFTGFSDHLKRNVMTWYKFYESAQPELLNLPEPWESSLAPFDKLMVFKIIRPDKLLEKMTLFISSIMGGDFVKPPPFDLWKSYSDSNKLRPLIFILSPGMDPMLPLNKLAEKMSLGERFSSISLGQGQGPIAEEMIAMGMQEGTWVCLQNCHLALSWMPQLEKIYEGMDFQNTHESFRLWLTSYPTDKFPVSILQNGVKMTNEPPTALQQNLQHMFSSEPIKDPSFMFSVPAKEKKFCKIIYALCFFHAVIQERRTFGPLGWNIPYGFNDSDLHISIQQVQMFMNEYEEVPYEALLYLIGECNYGGRVTDDWDRRLITTILESYLSKRVIERDAESALIVGDTAEGQDFSDQNYFLQRIKDMQTFQPPEVFGLHSNAGITRALQNTSIMLTSLLNLQGEATSAGEAIETLLLKLSSEILAKLPPAFDMEAAKQKYPVDYAESMNTVLVQELDRFNRLLNRIRSSLVVLEKAVQGLIAMTPDLDVLANSLLLSRIPTVWAQVSYPSLKTLPAYVSDFLERIEFLRNWYEHGKPTTFWLSGFFFTHAFLTGAKQNHARSKKIPIDQLDFDHEVMRSDFEKSPASLGVFVNGLFVDGARWNRDRHCLDEQLPRILSDILPVVWLKPILIEEFRDKGRYKSPVYKTSERRGVLSTTGHSTNYVLPIYLDTKEEPAHWIKRSVALLCQLD